MELHRVLGGWFAACCVACKLLPLPRGSARWPIACPSLPRNSGCIDAAAPARPSPAARQTLQIVGLTPTASCFFVYLLIVWSSSNCMGTRAGCLGRRLAVEWDYSSDAGWKCKLAWTSLFAAASDTQAHRPCVQPPFSGCLALRARPW